MVRKRDSHAQGKSHVIPVNELEAIQSGDDRSGGPDALDLPEAISAGQGGRRNELERESDGREDDVDSIYFFLHWCQSRGTADSPITTFFWIVLRKVGKILTNRMKNLIRAHESRETMYRESPPCDQVRESVEKEKEPYTP